MEIVPILRSYGIPFGGSFDLRSNPVVREQVCGDLASKRCRPTGGPARRATVLPARRGAEPGPCVVPAAVVGGTAVAGTGDAPGDRSDHRARVRRQAPAGH